MAQNMYTIHLVTYIINLCMCVCVRERERERDRANGVSCSENQCCCLHLMTHYRLLVVAIEN